MRVRIFQLAGPNWDPFTVAQTPLIKTAVSILATYQPFFNPHLVWFPNAWVYFDSYAIYVTDPVATAHPEWILKDASGNKLFIPWNCANGTCPQYAGDISNPLFRAYQIAQIQAFLQPGYAGLWLDDVNLALSTCDGTGKIVAPANITAAQWPGFFADYVQLIRASLDPSKGALHNSVWFVPVSAATQRQASSADLINIERGFGDPGITGGNGPYSLSQLMLYVDRIHQAGTGVVIEEYYSADVNYAVACYFLVTDGRDYIGFADQLPDATWPEILSADLGIADASRYQWAGLWRRDFERGIALVNEPGAASLTVSLPTAMRDSTGVTVSTVTLGPKQGGIWFREE